MNGKWRAKKKKELEGPRFSALIFMTHRSDYRQIVPWQQEPNFQSNHVRTKDQNGVGDAVVGAKYLPLHCLITKWKNKNERFLWGSVS